MGDWKSPNFIQNMFDRSQMNREKTISDL